VVEPHQLPPPVMGRGAGLDADKTTGQLLEKRQYPRPAQLAADHGPSRCIDAVDLENILRKINTDRDNFVHGRLLFPCG